MRTLFYFVASSVAACAGSTPVQEPQDTADSASLERDPCQGEPGRGQVAWGNMGFRAEYGDGTLYLMGVIDDAAMHRQDAAYDGSREQIFACVSQRPGPYSGERPAVYVPLAWVEAGHTRGRAVIIFAASCRTKTGSTPLAGQLRRACTGACAAARQFGGPSGWVSGFPWCPSGEARQRGIRSWPGCHEVVAAGCVCGVYHAA